MDSLYKPEGVEERWQRIWEEAGHYNADPDPAVHIGRCAVPIEREKRVS